MTTPGEVRFARAEDGVDIAYQVFGEGERDLVLAHGFTTHLDLAGDISWYACWLGEASERFRVIVFDKRGTGLSDRSLGWGSIEIRSRDIVAVMDAAGSHSASFIGISEGGPMVLTLAATHPARVERLTLWGSFARLLWAPDYPEGLPRELGEAFAKRLGDEWGRGTISSFAFMQHAPDPDRARDAMARFERNACTRQMAREVIERNLEIDVRPMLPGIVAPTLVLHNRDDPLIPAPLGRFVADHVARGEYVELDGDFHASWLESETLPIVRRALDFVDDAPGDAPQPPASTPAPASPRRAVSTVLLTDIVGSTDVAAKLGDSAWRSVLDDHDAACNEHVARLGGRLVKTTGDGMLATFDGPSRGIECARAVADSLRPSGLEIRAGVHTGEIERRGEDVGGIGVHIAARVAALAGPGEVWASRTVKDLTAGSGLVFTSKGTHALKGVPDEWELFAVDA